MGRRGRRSAADIPAGDVVRLYCDDGRSMAEIAQRLGWSMSAIRTRLVALGIARRRPWARNAVDIDLAEVVRLYEEEGLSLSAIAGRYGCALTTIWRKMQAAGPTAKVCAATETGGASAFIAKSLSVACTQ